MSGEPRGTPGTRPASGSGPFRDAPRSPQRQLVGSQLLTASEVDRQAARAAARPTAGPCRRLRAEAPAAPSGRFSLRWPFSRYTAT
ncbi:hypothetical protein MRX96_037347 [Rhipicephalus microplus]